MRGEGEEGRRRLRGSRATTLAKRKEQPWNFSAITSELVRRLSPRLPLPPLEIASRTGSTPPSDSSKWAGRIDLSSVSQLACSG